MNSMSRCPRCNAAVAVADGPPFCSSCGGYLGSASAPVAPAPAPGPAAAQRPQRQRLVLPGAAAAPAPGAAAPPAAAAPPPVHPPPTPAQPAPPPTPPRQVQPPAAPDPQPVQVHVVNHIAAQGPVAPGGEQTLFSQGGVRISKTRAVFDSTTYAMANISSVRMLVEQPNRLPPLLFGVLALFATYATGSVSRPSDSQVVFTGFLWLLALLTAVLPKPTYFVTITSASGEGKVLQSKDEPFIRAVVRALNEAIIARG